MITCIVRTEEQLEEPVFTSVLFSVEHLLNKLRDVQFRAKPLSIAGSPYDQSRSTHHGMRGYKGDLGTCDVGRVKARASSLRSRSLNLILNSHGYNGWEDQIEDFHYTFKRYGYNFELFPRDKTPGVFIVWFDNIMMAQEALLLGGKIGYSLLPRRLPCPSPK